MQPSEMDHLIDRHLAAERAGDCAFRPKPATQSGANRPPNPDDVGHLFRLNPATPAR